MTPESVLSVTPLCANSGVVVFPTRIAPAARRRATTAASSVGTRSARRTAPIVVRTPAVSSVSLTENGTPWRRPSGPPRITAASARRASARASSAVTVTKALRGPFTRSIRARTASTASTGDSALRAIAAASRAADQAHGSAPAGSLTKRSITVNIRGPFGGLSRQWRDLTAASTRAAGRRPRASPSRGRERRPTGAARADLDPAPVSRRTGAAGRGSARASTSR